MLIGEGQEWTDGEALAWQELSEKSPGDVCLKAAVQYDGLTGCYSVPMFGINMSVSPAARDMKADSRQGKFLLQELPHYSRLSILRYLLHAREIPPSGRLVNPRELKGGLIFAQGAHMLPLDRLAERYGADLEGLLEKGLSLGGEVHGYGDASVTLHPFPRVPVVLLMWQADDEFPSRAEVLFDATCSLHLPTDIMWATAMMSALLMLQKP